MYTELFETLYPINAVKDKGATVIAVDAGSVGERAGLKRGDRIVSANGHSIRDFLDFQFHSGSEDTVELEFVRGDGSRGFARVNVGDGEGWGLDFEYFAPRQCANDCIFCFCNQNPKGARPSLFFKDEDVRLSFLHGNYTTMSSISKMELDRIVEQRLSPQYVSVHATDPEVRRFLLGRKRPDDVMGKMRYLAGQGIQLHAQIVLCPGTNDGDVLKRTAYDLASLHPSLASVAVVPVVFTELHNYKHLLTRLTPESARALVALVRPWQRDFKNRLGTNFIFLADEIYMKAGLKLPGQAHYGDYPQIEDGVGMVRRFIKSSEDLLRGERLNGSFGRRLSALRGTIVTGQLFHGALAGFVEQVNSRTGSSLSTVAVENRFFGPEVTVAGLLGGGCILKARDRFEGDFLLVPEEACLKGGHIFLDDMHLGELERELGVPVARGGITLGSALEAACRLSAEVTAK